MEVNKQSIFIVLSGFLFETIENNEPHYHVHTKEPFYNSYKDKISYDYSGEVRKMEKQHFKEILDEIKHDLFTHCESSLEYLLESVYIDSWEPTYESNMGKHWVHYKDILEERFNEWKHENYNLYDVEEDEFDYELEEQLDDVFYDFLKETSPQLYIKKMKKEYWD